MSELRVRGEQIEAQSGEGWTLYHGDCVRVVSALEDESIGLSVFSPPFSNLYIYSDYLEDMGNCASHDEFFQHFSYLIEQLYRVTKFGRLCAVHCNDQTRQKGVEGVCGIYDFPGDIVRAFEKKGWTFHSRVTIWKDPVIEMQRTKNIGLLHKQLKKDSCASRMGRPDYVLVFRKNSPGEANYPDPVSHTADEFPVDQWQQWASPVWMDVRQTNVLQYQDAKDNEDERHICLARGSLVLTKDGYREIQTITPGDLVLTHKGRWRPVLAVQNTGVNQVVKVRAQGVHDLTVTPSHKLWARTSNGKARKKDAAKLSSPEWVEAQYLAGAYVNAKLPAVETPTNDNLLHWWIVGRWLADGHIDARNVAHISCGPKKFHYFMEKVGKIAGTPQKRTAYQVPLKDADYKMRTILEQCGKGASQKHLPPEAYTLPIEYASALLDGYLAGDGHYQPKRKRWYASSVSKELLLGISVLVQRVTGEIASLHAGRGPRQHVIDGRTVDAKQEWILSWGGVSHSFSFLSDDGAWKKVKSITKAEAIETWNLRVEEDESYTAEGCIVKNCPLQLDVIERCITLWSNPGDLVLSPFAGIGSEGYQALKMGRRFVGAELKDSYFEVAVRNLQAAVDSKNQLSLLAE
jgi:DNA modification methylase